MATDASHRGERLATDLEPLGHALAALLASCLMPEQDAPHEETPTTLTVAGADANRPRLAAKKGRT